MAEDTPTAPTDTTPTYVCNSWNGIRLFVCTACGESSFHLDRMRDHQMRAHDGRMVEQQPEPLPVPATQDTQGVLLEDMTMFAPTPIANDVDDAGNPIFPDPEPEEPPHG
jgi:hypothetical protein